VNAFALIVIKAYEHGLNTSCYVLL